MILLSNTVLFYKEARIIYEIIQTGAILFFKPFFYNWEEKERDLPFIVLIRDGNEWMFEDELDSVLKEQVMDDIRSLQIR